MPQSGLEENSWMLGDVRDKKHLPLNWGDAVIADWILSSRSESPCTVSSILVSGNLRCV